MKIESKKFDWWENNVTSEIYINTNRKDWWSACEKVAKEFRNAKSMIDIGGGDGHTLWQLISVLEKAKIYLKNILVLEPNMTATRRTKFRLSVFADLKQIYKIGILENNFSYLEKLYKNNKSDITFLGHVNYYFGNKDEKIYEKCLEFLPKIAKKVLIMTAPSDSDYYNILDKNPFNEKVYSDFVYEFYKSKGYRVRKIKIPMHFYVAHIFKSEHEAEILYKFFNDTQINPDSKQLENFKNRVSKYINKKGEINFKDELIVVNS